MSRKMPLLDATWRCTGSLSLWLVFLVGCKGAVFDPLDAAPSPQASAEPAPLANVSATATNLRSDAGPPPEPLRSDRPLATYVPREAARESGSKDAPRDPRELSGYVLHAVLRTGEGAPPPKGPEVNLSAIESARRKTEAHITIEASQTRARYVLSGGFVLPSGTELRARNDRYGHLVFWPGESSYRIAEPGALRALLGERRLDVAPLSPASVIASGEGARRLNIRTRRVEISTRAARAAIELASFREAGEGGVLICRMLLDLMNAPPSTAACSGDEVPLHAELRWTTQGALAFDVASIARRADLGVQDVATPPPSTSFELRPLPVPPGETMVAKADLSAFRSAPLDISPSSAPDAQLKPPDAGLLLVNSSDQLRVAWVDGVAVAWVSPGGQELLSSLVRGRYALQWRTFLGDAWEAPRMIPVPGASDVGGP